MTLYCKSLIYYTKFEKDLLSFLTFSIVVYLVEENIKFLRYVMFFYYFCRINNERKIY